MNSLGPFGLLTVAVGVAAVFVLFGAIPVLVIRNLMTGRPATTHLKEWLLYVLGAVPLIIAFTGFYSYAKHKGIDEHTTHKWTSILITGAIIFGLTANRFRQWWQSRRSRRDG
jgi:cellobiose-specific phosphotransferase system component IIC